MTRRRVLAAVTVLGLVAACGGPTTAPATSTTTPAAASPSPSAAQTQPGCAGVAFDQVVGTPPSFGLRELRPYSAAGAVCAAYWLPQVEDRFTAQAVVVDGTTAYVGGYRWNRSAADQPCQIAVVDTTTGDVRAFQPTFAADVYGTGSVFCRHGGGMQLDAAGLWVQETERLWLLDPAAIGTADPVRRVWRLGAGLRGSTMVLHGDRVGVSGFKENGPGRIYWFERSDVLAGGVDDLVASGGGASDARAIGSDQVPAKTQGITYSGEQPWYALSYDGSCGELARPDGTIGFVPGAEGIQLDGDDLWVVSEAGSRAYNGAQAQVPVLLRLSVSALPGTRPPCS